MKESSTTDEITCLRAENERLREALTPSAETKGAYIGEVENGSCADCGTQMVTWTATKDVMALIRTRAGLNTEGGTLMTDSTRDQPAFAHGDHTHGGAPGLTKREYAAIQIMAQKRHPSPEIKAQMAVEQADALMAELEKPRG